MNGSCLPGYTPNPAACVLGDASECIKPKVYHPDIIVPITLTGGVDSIRVDWIDLTQGFARFSWRKRDDTTNATRQSSGLISGTTGYYDITGLDPSTIYEISYRFESTVYAGPIEVITGYTEDGWTSDMTEVIHHGNLVYHNNQLVIK